MSRNNPYRDRVQKPVRKNDAFRLEKVISEHRRIPRAERPAPGMKRVQAIVMIAGIGRVTRHIDIPR